MIRTVLAVAAIVVGVTAVGAQSDVIAQRKAIMKQVGDDTKGGASMVRGENPFDLNKAQAIFAGYASSAEKMPGLFPDNTKTGGETTAGPKIWEETDKWKQMWVAFGQRAKDAQGSVKDLATFRTAFAASARDCQGCHDVYRVKK